MRNNNKRIFNKNILKYPEVWRFSLNLISAFRKRNMNITYKTLREAIISQYNIKYRAVLGVISGLSRSNTIITGDKIETTYEVYRT